MQTQLSRSGSRFARPIANRQSQPIVQSKFAVRVAEAEKVIAPAPSVDASKKASPVDFEELSDIIRLVNNTDIVELDLKSKRFNLTVRKREALKAPEVVQVLAPQVQYAPAPAMAHSPAAAAPAPAPAAAPAAAPAPPKPAAPPVGGVELVSPMGGTFYRSPAPGEPMFCKEGDRVKKGQVVGLIEAMKLMNEIESEISGEIVKVLAENGKPVSSGQPLFLIRP